MPCILRYRTRKTVHIIKNDVRDDREMIFRKAKKN